MKKNIPAIILFAALLAVWQAAAMAVGAHYILPSPVQIIKKLWDLRVPLFTDHLPATMGVTAIGLIISVIFGLFLAGLMDLYPKIEKALYPIIIASQTIPTTAISRPSFCAVVRLQHLEQSACNRAYNIFPHNHNRF